MKFSGEIKFPEIDHPGVPVQFVIEGRQAELVVEGESLGRWSLYDVHARRLVASAFQIDLGGTEITFVADDPIDFAYRGVEHMAETWASMKSKQVGRRMISVRKSRKGTVPSRIEELRSAMESNLDVQSRPLAGEPVMPSEAQPLGAMLDDHGDGDWDSRDTPGAIPLVGEPEEPVADPAEEAAAVAELQTRLAEEMRKLEEEKQRIAEERARLHAERQEVEERETVRIEAYRLEMQRLEAEREELRAQAVLAAQRAEELAAARAVPEEEAPPSDLPAEPGLDEEVAAEVPVDVAPMDEEPAPVPDEEMEQSPEVAQAEPVDGPETEVVDLSDLEEDGGGPEPDETPKAPTPQPQPVLAGAAPTRERGLRGAVRAAFARGSKEHDHQFIEAPGGLGITRYVCEICGYVSISVAD